MACGTIAPHRDLSANETYMAPPLILAADLWDTTILAIQQLFGFNLLRALASLKGFKYKPCLNAYSEASISPFKLSLHWLPFSSCNIRGRNVQFKPRRCRRCWDPVLQIGSLIVSHKNSKNRKVFLKNSRYLVYFCWGLHLWPLLTLAARLRASSNENILSKAVPPQNNTWNPISIKGTFQNYFFRQKPLFCFLLFLHGLCPKRDHIEMIFAFLSVLSLHRI